MKKKDRSEKKWGKGQEGTTSEVSRNYGQIVEKVVSRRTTEGEKRKKNREITLQRYSNGDRGWTKESNRRYVGAISFRDRSAHFS